MVQFYTDFSEYSTGSSPSDWSFLVDNATVQSVSGATGGNALEIDNSGVDNNFVWWDGKGGSDVEVLAKMRVVEEPGNGSPRLGVRINAVESGDAYLGNIFESDFIDEYVSIQHLDDGNIDGLAQTTTSTSRSSWGWYRIRANGNNIHFKWWLDSNTEPESWQVTTTDSTLSSGESGMYITSGVVVEVDEFGVGTNGNSAPMDTVIGQIFSQSLEESLYPVQSFQETPMKTLRQELSETIKTGRKQ